MKIVISVDRLVRHSLWHLSLYFDISYDRRTVIVKTTLHE